MKEANFDQFETSTHQILTMTLTLYWLHNCCIKRTVC